MKSLENDSQLKIVQIGYGGHGRRIRDAIRRAHDSAEVFNYDHHSGINSRYHISPDTLSSDCIFISSPTSTHVGYLDALRSCNYQGYIYCEKPGIDCPDNIALFKECLSYFSERIHIGYHRPFSSHHQKIRELISEDGFGVIRSFSIHEGFGLSYSSAFSSSWRAIDPMAISAVGISHILSSFLFFFPHLQPCDFGISVLQNSENMTWDTATIVSRQGLPFSLHGTYSWGTPCHEYMRIISSNSIVDINGTDLKVLSPRDYFDENHYFATPPSMTIQLPDQSIFNSVSYFLGHVCSRTPLPISETIRSCDISIRCLTALQIYQ